MDESVIKVELSKVHCIAAAWWIREKYIPFAKGRWWTTRDPDWLRPLSYAARLVEQFERAANRKPPNRSAVENIELDTAEREIDRDTAAWFGMCLDALGTDAIPAVFPLQDSGLPDAGTLAALPPAAAREIILGRGAYEAMVAVRDRVFARKPGVKKKLITREEAEARIEQNKALESGGDERYWRRLRRRALADETEAEIAAEWAERMRKLNSRSRFVP